MDDPPQVGRRLRSAREAQGLSLREVARRVDISASALSQIETGKSRPSVKTLYAIVSELGISMDELFAEPGARHEAAALSAAALPNFLFTTYPPVSSSSGSEESVRHDGREFGLVLSGELELTVGSDTHLLRPGDSCSFASNQLHRLANPANEPATAIWFVVGHRDSDPRHIRFTEDP